MYISISSFKIKAEKYDEMIEYANSLIPELREVNGLRHFYTVRTGEDSALAHVIYESKEAAENATPKIQEIFSRMAEFVTAPPERNVYELIINEKF
ncbi:MAG: hypothetical protein IIC64_16685 [SAR324 cluster bacterium]|nr:hypothetical protein [SAR324 cluster bacterium]